MRLLPYDQFTLDTQLDLPTVVNRLANDVEPPRWFRFFGPYRSFQGSVSENGFKLERLVTPSRTWMILHGRFDCRKDGTVLRLTVRPHFFGIVFYVIWNLFAVINVVVLIGVLIAHAVKPVEAMIGFACMLSTAPVAWALFHAGI